MSRFEKTVITEKPPVIAVLGPTASGKTALAIKLAREFDGEIVSCDSMQIYKGMDIATAKPTPAERAAAVHHLIDFLSPDECFSASDYVRCASKAIADIHARGKVAFLCGGTGLYADSLLSGMSFGEICGVEDKRKELTEFFNMYGKEALYDRLKKLDPEAAELICIENVKRVIRAIEVCECSGMTFTEYNRANMSETPPYRVLRLVLTFENREVLYSRINDRVCRMIEDGLVDEARKYHDMSDGCTSYQAIGYKELKPFFDGQISLDEAVENIKRATRRYAKRQITWFKRYGDSAVYLYADDRDVFCEAAERCGDFLKGR